MCVAHKNGFLWVILAFFITLSYRRVTYGVRPHCAATSQAGAKPGQNEGTTLNSNAPASFLMTVFCFWDSTPDAPPRQAELMTLWERSWAARGWEPRLLTEHMATKNPKYRKVKKPLTQTELRELALQSVNGKWVCPIYVINFSLIPPRPPFIFRAIWMEDYGRPGWKTSSLVDFGCNAAASDIIHCGRPLKI